MPQTTKNIYIGVDGGGTQCKLRIEDSHGKLLAQANDGPANIRLSVKKSWQSIHNALSQALSQAKLDLHDKRYNFHLGLGLAGTEVPTACHEFLSYPHAFKTLVLKSDAHVTCLGAHSDLKHSCDGAIIIIGTGVVGYQIEANDHTQVSGWGFPHDDLGGGAWLGLQAVKQTLQHLDHRLNEPTLLYNEIFQRFNKNLSQFVSWANQANSSEFATLAPIVIHCVKENDLQAIALMQQAATHINRVNSALLAQQRNQKIELPCCLFGGIAPFLKPWLDKSLKDRLRLQRNDAIQGAIYMLHKITEDQHTKIRL